MPSSSARRLDGLKVTASHYKKGTKTSRLCTTNYLHFGLGEKKEIVCRNGTTGRYVRLELPGPSRILKVCEVQVHGTPGKTKIAVIQEW